MGRFRLRLHDCVESDVEYYKKDVKVVGNRLKMMTGVEASRMLKKDNITAHDFQMELFREGNVLVESGR